MNENKVVAWRVFYPATSTWTIFQQYPTYFYENHPELVEELIVKCKIVKKVCVNKIDGLCPLNNVQCNYPECEEPG